MVGPNGAGKTTLLRAISGLIAPRAGRVTFEGAELAGKPAYDIVAHGIAHVPEGRRLFPQLTVAENLKMGAFLPAARAHFHESLERVYTLFPVLAERSAQRAGSLSGGEQQMVAVGRALMSRPKLILFDEPSMGLAPVMVLRLFDMIRTRAGRGLHHPGRRAERAAGAQARGPRLSPGGRAHQDRGPRRRPGRAGLRAQGLRGLLSMLEPIFILEAVVNGILLGGVLALLALGLNLIFGVIDIVWIAYVDLVALCMYGVYFLVTLYGWPLWLAGLAAIGIGAVLGMLVHLLIITPILSSPPINQLLATGGLLFFIQSVATLLWSTDHRSVRVSLPTIEVGGIFISFSRLLAFGLSILAMIALYLFLKRTYTGTAIRAVSQDREAIALMGARPQRLYLVTSAVGGAMAGVAGALLIIQYAVHPYFGGRLRAADVHDLRAGRPRQHGGRLLRRVHHGPGHLGGRGDRSRPRWAT